MKIDVKKLEDGPVDLEVNASPEELELVDEMFRFTGPVTGKVTYTLAGDKVYSRGEVTAPAETDCARCLTPVRLEVHAPVEALYENNPELLKPEQELAGSEDELIAYYDGETVHPEPQLRESIMINLPFVPLCREDCKGLCPGCGADLNVEQCTCAKSDAGVEEPAPKADSSWKNKLKTLRIDEKDK